MNFITNDRPFYNAFSLLQEYVHQTYPVDLVGDDLKKWIPADASKLDPKSTYGLEQDAIMDFKGIPFFDAQWNPIPVSDPNNLDDGFLKYFQKNRIVYADCAGVSQAAELSWHNIIYRKINDEEWIMVEKAISPTNPPPTP